MKTIVINLPNGYHITAIENTRIVFEDVWEHKVYERDFCIKPGMTVIDIGANQGFFSLYAAHQGARVFSVEPEAENFRILRLNIENNHLREKVSALRYALSDHTGYLDLFTQDFDEHAASAIVSSSKVFLGNINRLGRTLQTQRVPCLTLDELFHTIGTGAVDLVKMDCEGVELGILKHASPETCDRIGNLVMETHDAYDEKELIVTLHAKGFTIVAHQSFNRKDHIGYLFAERTRRATRPPCRRPIARFICPARIFRKQAATFDASRSFSLRHPNVGLQYFWSINGKRLGGTAKPELTHVFKACGRQIIGLQVRDGNEKSVVSEKSVWVLTEDYFKEKPDEITYDGPYQEETVRLKGTRYFSMTAPGSWQHDHAFFLLEYKETKNHSAVFECNGRRWTLKNDFTNIRLPGIPPEMEIRYSLTAREEETLRVCCGFDSLAPVSEEERREIQKLNPGIVVLGQKNEETVHRFRGRREFLIYRGYFPPPGPRVSGPPKLHVAVTLLGKTRGAPPAASLLECGNEHYAFKDLYQDFRLSPENFNQDFRFCINAGLQARRFRIEWWHE